MTQQDYKEFQQLCEAHGYTLLNSSADDNEKFFVVTKTDIFKDVAYVKCIEPQVSHFTKGKVYRMSPGKTIDQPAAIIDDLGHKNGFYPNNREYFTPSTQEEYVKSLMTTAYTRYSTIHIGDVFKLYGSTHTITSLKQTYDSRTDTLYLGDTPVYSQNVWADKQVALKVMYTSGAYDEDTREYTFKFIVDGHKWVTNGMGASLAQHLKEFIQGLSK